MKIVKIRLVTSLHKRCLKSAVKILRIFITDQYYFFKYLYKFIKSIQPHSPMMPKTRSKSFRFT